MIIGGTYGAEPEGWMPVKPCPGRGIRRGHCPNVVKAGLCPECQAVQDKTNAQYDEQRDKTAQRLFIHSAAWRAERKAYLREHPLCERCGSRGFVRVSVLVHHIDGNELNRAGDNKQALCNDCHEGIHGPSRWKRKVSE